MPQYAPYTASFATSSMPEMESDPREFDPRPPIFEVSHVYNTTMVFRSAMRDDIERVCAEHLAKNIAVLPHLIIHLDYVGVSFHVSITDVTRYNFIRKIAELADDAILQTMHMAAADDGIVDCKILAL